MRLRSSFKDPVNREGGCTNTAGEREEDGGGGHDRRRGAQTSPINVSRAMPPAPTPTPPHSPPPNPCQKCLCVVPWWWLVCRRKLMSLQARLSKEKPASGNKTCWVHMLALWPSCTLTCTHTYNYIWVKRTKLLWLCKLDRRDFNAGISHVHLAELHSKVSTAIFAHLTRTLLHHKRRCGRREGRDCRQLYFGGNWRSWRTSFVLRGTIPDFWNYLQQMLL